MLRCVGDFKRLDFHNIKTIKFFNADDFGEFQVAPSTVHHRMIMNAVAKHQKPYSKLGLSGNDKKQNVFEPKKLSFVAGNTFDDDDEEGEQQQFVYKSPAELMLDELEVSMHFYSFLFSKEKGGGCKTDGLFSFNIRERHFFPRKNPKQHKTKLNKPKYIYIYIYIYSSLNFPKLNRPSLRQNCITSNSLFIFHMCMFPFLKYFSITLPYYLCKIIHILLLIATNI